MSNPARIAKTTETEFKRTMKKEDEEMPEVPEVETTQYGAECPGCGDWHESECHLGIVDCTCGMKFKAKR